MQADDPVLAVLLLAEEEAHRDAHPEELGRLEAAGRLDRLVDDQVAVVHRLHAEELEVEVGHRVEGGGELGEVVLAEIRREAADRDAAFDVGGELGAMEFLELGDAVAGDAPAEDFLVDVGEADAGGELGEVGVDLDEALGVELDGLAEVGLGDLVEETAAQLGLDLVGGADELEPGGGEGDALAQLLAVPEVGGTVAGLDEDHRLLAVVDHGRLGGLLLADAGAVGAVEDVVLGHLEVVLAHQLLLDEVLDLLDADDGLAEVGHAAGDAGGDALGGRGVEVEGEEGHAHGDGDLLGDPRDDMAVAAHEAGGDGRGLAGGRAGGTAGEEQALGHVVAVVAHEGVLDGLEHHAVGDLDAGEAVHDVAGDGGDELAVGLGEDLLLLAGDEEVGEGRADDVGDLGGVEAGGGGAAGGDGGQRFTPVEARLGGGGGADGVLEGDVFAEKREFGFHAGGKEGGGKAGGGGVGGGRRRVVDRVMLGVSVNRKRASPGRGGGDARKPAAVLRVRRR